jgi:hypothetical protein
VVHIVIRFHQLTGQRTVYASALAVDRVHVGYAGAGPRLQRLDAVKGAQSGLGVKGHHIVAPGVDDLARQIALVTEVMRHL